MKRKITTLLGVAALSALMISCSQGGTQVAETTTEADSSSETSDVEDANETEADTEDSDISDSDSETELESEDNGDSENSEDSDIEALTTNGGSTIQLSDLNYYTDDESSSTVYFLSDISSEALVEIYEALEFSPSGKVAVKISTGESENSNHLRPELITDLVSEVDGTIVENSTAYGGSRASVALSYQVAEDHGYNDIADVKILDEDGSLELPITDGLRLTEARVGAATDDFSDYIVLSHFKGHAMAGFGGALKNVGIGMQSQAGKALVHSAGVSSDNWLANMNASDQQDAFLESMADAVKATVDHLDGEEHMIYISVMNRLSVDCDCDGNPAEPDMHDIGILASLDPVALDQACVDLVYASVDDDNASLIERMESRDGIHVLESAENLGIGNRAYHLEVIG